MSDTKGKFYIRLAGAYVKPYYWDQAAQNCVEKPELATMFDTFESAMDEAEYAEASRLKCDADIVENFTDSERDD